MRWTVEEVALALGVTRRPGASKPWPGWPVSVILAPWLRDELFVTIHGPRHDGHNFVVAALEAGAPACVVSQDRLSGFAEPVRSKLLAVPDTLAALQDLAQAVRTRWGKRLAAVTGSAGKTTTKEILAALLAARFRVLKSEGNLNNEFGLPLQLLRLDDADEAAVVELGMSHAGGVAAPGRNRAPECGRCHARRAGASGIFRIGGRHCALAKREIDQEGLTGADTVAVLECGRPACRAFRTESHLGAF